MIKVAEKYPDYSHQHPGVIREMTMEKALGQLCPLFPSC